MERKLFAANIPLHIDAVTVLDRIRQLDLLCKIKRRTITSRWKTFSVPDVSRLSEREFEELRYLDERIKQIF